MAGLPPIAGIAAGDNHSLAWTSSGQLYAWGANGSYQLGDGSTTARTSPVLITAVSNVTQAAGGASHTLVRTTDGAVRAWGHNGSGQLGDGTITTRSTPVVISTLTGVSVIGAGANHSLAATTSTTYAWGANGSSQVGDNVTPLANRPSPVALGGLAGSVQLAGGPTHSAAVEIGGAVWLWGGNTLGQLGNGGTTTGTGPVQTTGDVAQPTATPGPQTAAANLAVTLTSTTPGATIRYTVTGVEPVDTDPIATAPVAITGTTTLKAKAWKTPLTPSAVTTAVYTLRPATPSLDQASQTSTTPLAVRAETTTPDATLRYTLDGTPPGPSSPPYPATELTITESSTLTVVAFRPGWTPSEPVTATYEIVQDLRPPTITARIRPGANPQGWSTGPVTVTFICHDFEGPVQGCPGPVSVTEETDGQPFSATIQDVAGNVATASGTVKVDVTPPLLTLTSPADGIEVSSALITLTGTASDTMSGLAAVRCNGVLATVSPSGAVSCDVPLRAGRNPVVLQASDVAGHSSSVGIVVWRTVAVDRLTLSPQQVTLLEGEERPLRLVNNMGRVQTNATWSVNAPTVVEVVEDGEPTLRALAPGTAVVTATVGGLSVYSTVTVLGETMTLAPGTTRWLVQTMPGHTLEKVIYTHQTSPDVPEAVLVEAVTGTADQLVLRGVSGGATTSLTPVSGPVPLQTMGDSFGGVILAQGPATEPTTLQRVGFTPDVPSWRWVSSGTLTGIVQIHDGTIFATERVKDHGGVVTAATVMVLDGATGRVRARVPIDASTYHHFLIDDGTGMDCQTAAPTTVTGVGLSEPALWALSTADVYGVVTHDLHRISFHCGAPARGSHAASQHLLTVDRDGASTTTLLSQRTETYPAPQAALAMPEATALAPDARGNFVVTFEDQERQLFGLNPTGPVLPVDEGVMVSAGGLYVHRQDDVLRAIDIVTGQVAWSAASAAVPIAFTDDGRRAILAVLADEVVEVGPDASVFSMTMPGSTAAPTRLSPGHLTYATTTALATVVGPNVHLPEVSSQNANAQKRGIKRSRPDFVTIDAAGVAALREYFPLGMERPNVEYGGSMCRLPNGRYLYADGNIGLNGEVVPTPCPVQTTHYGEWHTHPRCGLNGPSGGDVGRLRTFNQANPGARGYVGVPDRTVPSQPVAIAIKYFWPADRDAPISESMAYLSWPNNRPVPCP